MMTRVAKRARQSAEGQIYAQDLKLINANIQNEKGTTHACRKVQLQFLQKLVMHNQWLTEKTKSNYTLEKNIIDFMSRDQYKLDCYSSAEEVMSLSFVKT
jgi:hypothetical protein